MSTRDVAGLLAAARKGDQRATGRLISVLEDDPASTAAAIGPIYGETHDAWVTGLTGAPGAGKSTLADGLTRLWRRAGRRVAVLAVDPTSPFTGGALLGDRVRMQHGSTDPGVLVRSMATRGQLGGLAPATERVALLCAGLGYDEILIETVGVGQSEVDIAAAADTTIVAVTPAWGDGVQVAKAGIMEIGDVFVVNKADRAGANETLRDLREMLQLAGPAGEWDPPVVATIATTGSGLDELHAALETHRRVPVAAGTRSRLEARRERDLERAVTEAAHSAARARLDSSQGRELRAAVLAGAVDPWTAAGELVL